MPDLQRYTGLKTGYFRCLLDKWSAFLLQENMYELSEYNNKHFQP